MMVKRLLTCGSCTHEMCRHVAYSTRRLLRCDRVSARAGYRVSFAARLLHTCLTLTIVRDEADSVNMLSCSRRQQHHLVQCVPVQASDGIGSVRHLMPNMPARCSSFKLLGSWRSRLTLPAFTCKQPTAHWLTFASPGSGSLQIDPMPPCRLPAGPTVSQDRCRSWLQGQGRQPLSGSAAAGTPQFANRYVRCGLLRRWKSLLASRSDTASIILCA